MDDEIARLGKNLSLSTEEENGVVMPLDVWHSDSDIQVFCVAGKILSHKSLNFEAMQSTLTAAFNPIRGMDMKMIEGNRLLFCFNHPVDRKRVLENAPWAYEKSLLVLKAVDSEENPMKADLDWCDFHVQIHDLPLGKMNRDFAQFIGNQIGDSKKWTLTNRKSFGDHHYGSGLASTSQNHSEES
ncbi:UNVERIFIED_CONTAM: hypothetical protein Sradi_1777600 [Sesamum radiatum]|uniref:DUF4283 domain-containing protein n=1 Tax=Sesamum radiatum TaxID=300843 RepID=A0AAW2TV48_SESRA